MILRCLCRDVTERPARVLTFGPLTRSHGVEVELKESDVSGSLTLSTRIVWEGTEAVKSKISISVQTRWESVSPGSDPCSLS